MKKILSIVALLGLLIPSISQATLYDFYEGNLPSIKERSVLYSEIADDTYYGTASQNNALESYLRGNEVLGATTKIKLTDENSVTPSATATPTASKIPIADGSGKLDDGWLNTILNKSFIAVQNFSAGEAVAVGTGETFTGATYTGSDEAQYSVAGNNWKAQTFVARGNKIKTITIWAYSINSRTLTISIREVSANVPTGSDIEGKTATVTTEGGAKDWTATFSSAVSVIPGNTYAIVVRGSGSIDGNEIKLVCDNTSPTFTEGNYAESSNAGSSWSANTGIDFNFTILEESETGKIYKTNATYNNFLANNFIGFAKENITAGDSGNVIFSGISNVHTGLTVGSTYYLSNTPGAIATSAGSQSRKIGLSISATELLIKHNNP